MRNLNDEERKIIQEELLNEANYRRYDRFWYNHWQLLSHFSPKTRNKIMDIEILIISIPVFIVLFYIFFRLFLH